MALFAAARAAGDSLNYQSFVYGSFVWGIHVRYNNKTYQHNEQITKESCQHWHRSSGSIQNGGVSTNRLLGVWKTLLSFIKYFLSNTFSQNIDNCSVAFSLLFSIYRFNPSLS